MSYAKRLSCAVVFLSAAGCSGTSASQSPPAGVADSGAEGGKTDASTQPEAGDDGSAAPDGSDASNGGDGSADGGDAAAEGGDAASDGGVAPGSFVFVGTAGFNVIDATNPAALTLAGKLATGGLVTGIASAGSYAYATSLEKGDSGVVATTLLALDTASPANVTQVGSSALASPAQGLCPLQIFGNNLYVGETGALEIFDITAPTSPVHLSSTTVSSMDGFVRGIALSGNYAYLTFYPLGDAGTSGDLVVVDVSKPATPTVVSTTLVPNSAGAGPGAIAVGGTHVYLTQDEDGLVVFDVSNPASPTVAGSLSLSGPTDIIALSGNYVYAGQGDKLNVIDITNPASPTLATTVKAQSSLYSVVVAGSYAYATGNKNADPAAGPGTVEVFDISKPASPTSVGSYETLPEGTLAAVSVLVRP